MHAEFINKQKLRKENRFVSLSEVIIEKSNKRDIFSINNHQLVTNNLQE